MDWNLNLISNSNKLHITNYLRTLFATITTVTHKHAYVYIYIYKSENEDFKVFTKSASCTDYIYKTKIVLFLGTINYTYLQEFFPFCCSNSDPSRCCLLSCTVVVVWTEHEYSHRHHHQNGRTTYKKGEELLHSVYRSYCWILQSWVYNLICHCSSALHAGKVYSTSLLIRKFLQDVQVHIYLSTATFLIARLRFCVPCILA